MNINDLSFASLINIAYATGQSYIKKNCKIIETFNFTKEEFDIANELYLRLASIDINDAFKELDKIIVQKEMAEKLIDDKLGEKIINEINKKNA